MIKKKRKTAHQNLGKNYKKYKRKNLKKKQLLYWRKKTLTHHQHGRFMQTFDILKRKSQIKTKRKREDNKHISDRPRHTSLQSRKLSNKKTAGCSQWPAQPSAGRSHCPGRRSQKRSRPSCTRPPAWRGRSSSSSHRTPAAQCDSQCPAFSARAASARAKAPDLPSSYSACTTCNKLRIINNL